MGTVTTKPSILNGLKKGFDKLAKVQDIELDANHLVVFSSKKTFIEFGGAGLEFALDDKGAVTGVSAGDVTSVKVVIQGKTVIELSGISVPAASIYDAIASGSPKTALDLILAESGSITGTKFADQMFGGDGADKLFGFGGNDGLDGGAGDDLLDGGKGRDKLIGGEGSDAFLFRKSSGSDVVVDFGNGDDVLDVSRLKAITSFEDLMSNHARQVNDDVHITAGSGVKIVLKDFDKGSFVESDFLF
jgi:Ca2+-binding RTX toxin-like protein